MENKTVYALIDSTADAFLDPAECIIGIYDTEEHALEDKLIYYEDTIMSHLDFLADLSDGKYQETLNELTDSFLSGAITTEEFVDTLESEYCNLFEVIPYKIKTKNG
jgi:hypothetical protein